ncbi:MAG: ATP-binding cassette domain-containing protein [Acidimicrobiia bacterium]
MSSANRIETSALTVEHATPGGLVRALEHAGLTIEGGEGVAIMGPSGCGKSTLLGLLAGLALPTSGHVAIGPTAISALSERERAAFRRRWIGMVYQADNLLPHLTVEENVGLQLAIGRPVAPAFGGEPRTVLDRLGLQGLWTRLPDQLSGGQRQRVAIARAVICGPAVILADEPTGALDADNARRVIELLVEVHTEIGATLVVVTHDPTIAGRVARTEHLARPRRHEEPAGAGAIRPR